jgi:hypothetical protein
VYSELNYGTTFKIYLPRLLMAGHQPEQVSPVRHLSGGGETILLVEDEPAVRELAVKVLRRTAKKRCNWLKRIKAKSISY